MIRNRPRSSEEKTGSLFVFEGKNDYLIIGIVFLLLAFFILGGFLVK
jgi:hypothetical protein